MEDKPVEIAASLSIISLNNTSHASRQNGAPWEVTFFWGWKK